MALFVIEWNENNFRCTILLAPGTSGLSIQTSRRYSLHEIVGLISSGVRLQPPRYTPFDIVTDLHRNLNRYNKAGVGIIPSIRQPTTQEVPIIDKNSKGYALLCKMGIMFDYMNNNINFRMEWWQIRSK